MSFKINYQKYIEWDYCEYCEAEVVHCLYCGNFTCSAGEGKVTIDGVEMNCPICPLAYQEMKGFDKDKEYIISLRHENKP